MNNYEYIIAGLPVISNGRKVPDGFDVQKIILDIKSQCSARDCATIDCLLEGFVDDNLDKAFYERMFHNSEKFISDYFKLDLNMRNSKVRFINRELERPADMDVIDLDGGTFERSADFQAILENTDILARERGIDDFLWNELNGMTLFNYFNMTVILAFIAKIQIIGRWLKLDEENGRKMFRKLVDEVRGTFKGVEFED